MVITSLLVANTTVKDCRKGLLVDLFGNGVTSLNDCLNMPLRLPRLPNRLLKEKKILSLAKKIFSIPKEYHHLYPKISTDLKAQAAAADSDDDETQSTRARKSKRKASLVDSPPSSVAKKSKATSSIKRKVGRPLKPKLIPGQISIMQFFKKKTA